LQDFLDDLLDEQEDSDSLLEEQLEDLECLFLFFFAFLAFLCFLAFLAFLAFFFLCFGFDLLFDLLDLLAWHSLQSWFQVYPHGHLMLLWLSLLHEEDEDSIFWHSLHSELYS